jgi:phospholipase/lecithinase/hemolysin
MLLADPLPAWVSGSNGTNYAVAAAKTGNANLTDMQNQVALFLSQHPTASASALYAFWGGSNDILQGNNPVQAADNIENEIKTVAAVGGKYFLWLNEPPLGDTPGVAVAGQTAAANAASAAFNSEWQTDLTALNSMGIDVIGVDVNALFNQILSNPSTYGFADVSDACTNFAPFNTCTSASNPNSYLFWDDLHPTTQADMWLANAVYADVQAAPEPTSFALVLFAGVGYMALRRARKRRCLPG